jgi:hypothetical protein
MSQPAGALHELLSNFGFPQEMYSLAINLHAVTIAQSPEP